MIMLDNTIKKSLRDLSETIKANQQALDNAVSEIEYLERQNLQLKQQIQFAYKMSDGSFLSLEELSRRYDVSLKILEQVGDLYVERG